MSCIGANPRSVITRKKGTNFNMRTQEEKKGDY